MHNEIENALYIVATPIGNLADITYRAVSILNNVDIIACEDTRNSSKLLKYYDIKTKVISYHDHNGEMMRPKILQELKNGKSVALISDAGSPLINDPGYKLVQYICKQEFKIIPIPGASSTITAIMGAGLPTDLFTFKGFLPNKKIALQNELKSLNNNMGTVLYFESPKRIRNTISEIKLNQPNANIAIGRELTKKFEQFIRGNISEIETNDIPEKGEFVLLINIPSVEFTDDEIDNMIIKSLENMSVKNTAVAVALETGVPKSKIYAKVVEIAKK